MQKIMLVEDDIYLREELVRTLAKAGYSVSSISSFVAPGEEILSSEPDLVILDVNLPNISGFTICKWLKRKASFPVLMLTSRDELSDELHGLELGADDYLTKPCHPDRLIARVARLLSTYNKVRNTIQVEDLSLDIDSYKVVWKDKHILLPETEGKIMQVLMEHHPSIVSKQMIFAFVWGSEEYVDENILQVNMVRLRKNLSAIGLKSIVNTVRGQGYNLDLTIGMQL